MTFVRRAPHHAPLALLVIAAIALGACSPAAAAPSSAVAPSPSPARRRLQPPIQLAHRDAVTHDRTHRRSRSRTARSGSLYCWYVTGKKRQDLILARADGTDAHAIAHGPPGWRRSAILVTGRQPVRVRETGSGHPEWIDLDGPG